MLPSPRCACAALATHNAPTIATMHARQLPFTMTLPPMRPESYLARKITDNRMPGQLIAGRTNSGFEPNHLVGRDATHPHFQEGSNRT
jgi:hypothetical protein